MKAERYTPEQIHYMENGCSFIGNDRFCSHVTLALSKTPGPIAKVALSKCLFIHLAFDGLFIPKTVGRHIIIFPPRILKLSSDEIQKTILHEVAHFHLGHKHPTVTQGLQMIDSETNDQWEQKEKEADELADKWFM